MGASVGKFARGADEAGGADRSGAGREILALFPGQATDCENTIGLQGLFQHLTVAILEDVQRKSAVREEGAIRQEDHTDVFG